MNQCIDIKWMDIKLNVIRFDLGQIKNVIQKLQECLRRREGFLNEPPWVILQPGFLQQHQNTDNRVHGCADLVAHIGKEGRFDGHRRFRLLLLFLKFRVQNFQLLFTLHDIGYVNRGRHETPLTLQSHRVITDHNIADLTLAVFKRSTGLNALPFQRLLIMFAALFDEVGAKHLLQILANGCFFTEREPVFSVGVHKTTRESGVPDRHG